MGKRGVREGVDRKVQIIDKKGYPQGAANPYPLGAVIPNPLGLSTPNPLGIPIPNPLGMKVPNPLGIKHPVLGGKKGGTQPVRYPFSGLFGLLKTGDAGDSFCLPPAV